MARHLWRRLAPRRRRGWVWVALTLGLVLNGVRLRQRLTGLHRLGPGAGGEGEGGGDDFVVLCRPGVEVSAAARAAAARYAEAEKLDVLDLVPANLFAEQAVDLARAVDTATYRSAPLAAGRGARHAVLVRRDVAKRAEAVAPGDGASFVRLTERLKQHAPRSTDLAVAEGAPQVAGSPAQRVRELRAMYGGATPVALAIPAARSAMLLGGMVLSPGWGAAALAAFLAQPYLATAGTAIRVADRSPGAGIQRALEPFRLVRSALAADGGAGDEDPIEVRRAGYAADLAQGTERFFEPRRTTCPWCGGAELKERIRTTDLLQFKPGEFVLEECTTCGLVFQNPRLSIAGLDFYYRDFYDGLGTGEMEFVFAQSERSYRGRVELARRHTSPERWLDVGSGYGHFCLIARGLLPHTQFDGLDMGASIEEAQRRGWVDVGYRGLFPDLAGDVAGRYQMVSMFHYLEHTREPRAELASAHTALAPGGHLLIEVPDPECPIALLLGQYWIPWLQPQHQQLLPVASLCAALEEQGFAVIEVEHCPANPIIDLAGGLWMWSNAVAPRPRSPWSCDPTPPERLLRAAILATAVPVAVLGVIADLAAQPLIKPRALPLSNAYRVLAQRR